MDLLDKSHQPTLEEVCAAVQNPLCEAFCAELAARYRIAARPEFSSCSWAPGWNLKFRKSGRNLCTLYPKEQFFTVLVVVGQRERAEAEALLPSCAPRLRELYANTAEGGGQRWLMIDLEDADDVYRDTLRLIEIRYQNR